MKIKKIYIFDTHRKSIFKGPLLNLPYHKIAVKEMCIELFDDDNPCVIHESYAIQKLADQMERILLEKNQTSFLINHHLEEMLTVIDFNPYLGCQLEIEVKK